jgi:uncharacterized protein DUF6080
MTQKPRLNVTETSAVGRSRSPRRATLYATLFGATAVVWFTLLSGWLGIAPGSVLLTRQNVFFNSDANVWIDEIARQHAPSAATRAIHPLEVFIWRPPYRIVYHLLQLVVPQDRVELLAARLLVALVSGAGVGVLAWLALTLGIELPQCLLLFAMYLLFTSSSTIAMPEHFGLSNGLLSIAFVVPIAIANRRVRTAVLAALAVVCGGTTLTNVLYPLFAMYQWSLNSVRARRAIIVAALVTVPLAIFLFADSRKVVMMYTESDKDIASRVAILPRYVPGITRVYLKTSKIHGHVGDFLNLRLVRHPLDAAVYSGYALVTPAVGPPPAVRITKGRPMVTYESGRPLHWDPNGFFSGSDSLYLRDWGVQAVGAALWAALFLSCAYRALRDRNTRPLVWLPAAWILFNLVFHNLWGDEQFLYAPHWSWALMAIVLLGARPLSLVTTASFVVPIAACQAYTLFRIKSLLLTIVQ